MTNKTTTMMIRNVPIDLRDHFKAWCAKRRLSMKEVIISMMRETLKGNRTYEIQSIDGAEQDSIESRR